MARGLRFLARRDAGLREILRRLGPPPMWEREPGFPTLVHIMLEQQVSLASARAAFDRLAQALPRLTAHHFLELDDLTLRKIGFSRQKTTYVRHLARSIADGETDLDALKSLDDAEARNHLTKLKGIGPWTSDIYLLMALRRPDIWPSGDLALAIALQNLRQLRSRPTPFELDAAGENWRPWRAVAARLLWYHYLNPIRPDGTSKQNRRSANAST
jgi:DNA-3-methyladenine glycosylase II